MLRAAVALADEGGIESLTMRRLARSLGVEAMSLYHYVAKKDDILDGILDLVHEEVELPGTDTEWKSAIRQTAISAHAALLRHPWACSLTTSSTRVSPARLRYMETLLAALRQAGFSRDLTDHAYHALEGHITGFTLWQVNFQFEAEDLPQLAATFLRELPVDEYPHVAEHVEYHLSDSGASGEDEFEFGLDLILDGIERLRDSV